MCVAMPGRIIAIHEPVGLSVPADVEFVDGVRRVDLAMVDDARVGDFVIVHSGFAIRRLEAAEASRTVDVWRGPAPPD